MKRVLILTALLASFSGATVLGGMKYGSPRVEANSSIHYDYTFIGNQDALVTISGDGDTDLDLYIYDQNGNEVCRSTANGDDEYCAWNPRWTGAFRVKIKNYGNIYNRFNITIQ